MFEVGQHVRWCNWQNEGTVFAVALVPTVMIGVLTADGRHVTTIPSALELHPDTRWTQVDHNEDCVLWQRYFNGWVIQVVTLGNDHAQPTSFHGDDRARLGDRFYEFSRDGGKSWIPHAWFAPRVLRGTEPEQPETKDPFAEISCSRDEVMRRHPSQRLACIAVLLKHGWIDSSDADTLRALVEADISARMLTNAGSDGTRDDRALRTSRRSPVDHRRPHPHEGRSDRVLQQPPRDPCR